MISTLAKTNVREISRREPVRVTSGTSLREAIELLREHNRGVAIVEDEAGKLLGVLTEHDVVSRVDHSQPDWQARAVSDCMTASPVTVRERAALSTVVHKMEQGAFRRLPIVDADGRATGIVTVRDVLRYLVDTYPGEFLNLPPGPGHEASKRWGG